MVEKTKEESLLINDARASYLYVFKPYEGEGKPKYTGHLIIPETHPQLPAITATIRKVAAAKWGPDAELVLESLKHKDMLCIHRGNISKPGKAEYAGKLFISSSNDAQPRILATVNGINQVIDESHELAPYSGCHVNATIIIWAMDNKYGRRINAQLTGVQFLRHDARMGGGGRAASLDEFGVVAGDADSSAPTGGASLL